jgi:hypothetical protein
MATCPNINLQSWKDLVQSQGEELAYYLWDKYDGNVPENPVVREISPRSVAVVKEFLSRIGVDIKTVQNIVINGTEKRSEVAAAEIMQKLIQVVEGREAEALPEEAMHFAVEILEQNDPQLFNKLLSEINNYRILKETFADYANDPKYQTADGKPNVRLLKKEAIAKVLAQTIINKTEGLTETNDNLAKVEGWWNQIVQFFKNLFTKSGFDEAAMKIVMGEDIGTADDIRAAEDLVLFQKNAQSIVYDKLKNIAAGIEKKDDGYYINGKKTRRVTDIVKDWYDRRFKDKDLTKSDYSKAVDDLKKEKGTAGHADLENAFKTFVDENGFLRDTPLDDTGYVSQVNPNNRDMYELLKNNLKDRLNSFPAGTRFLSEATVFDPKRNLAGTIDFLAITPTGETNILDWKFMDLNVDKYLLQGKRPDVPWYKVNAWRQQMDQYKLILQNAYGVKPQDFKQTRMIPIQTTYSQGNAKLGILPQLLNIKIGDVNVKNISDDYLLPVGLEGEKTGNKKIDALIEKLNAVYKKFSEKKVLPSEKLSKAEQLNALFTAIRQLQIKGNLKPLLLQAKTLNKQIQATINTYNNKFKGVDPKTLSNKEINDFAEELQTAQDALRTYVNLDTDLRGLFTGELTEEDVKLKDDLRDAADAARDYQSTLDEVLNDYTSDIIAGSEGVDNLLSPEKIIKGFTRWFSSTATLQLKSMELLYKKANKAFAYAGYDTLEETRKLEKLKESYDAWAKGKGLNKDNYFDILRKKDKNELINEFDTEFYSTLKKKIEEKDFEWIRDNIDATEYNKFLAKKLEEELERIDNRARLGTEEDIAREINREKAQARQLYSLSTTESPGWLLYDYANKFPKRETWESKEWKELTKPENKAAKDFYDYIRERNAEYRDLGYISKGDERIFLPFVRKGLVEKLVLGGDVRIGEQFLRSISVDEGEIGYGQIDPLTGKPVDTIPKYFTSEIEGEVSTDLFRTMSLYNEAAIRYKYLSEIEDQIRAVVAVERNKKAIATSVFGKTEYKDGMLQYTPDNNENSKLVEDMMKSIIYGQKFLTSETFDQLLGKIGNWGERINKKMGINLFPEDLSERQVSVNKIIDSLNTSFSITALGLNPLSAISNYFGGTAQSVINSGRYFTKTDYAAAQGMLFINKMRGEDGKKMIGALEYFLPLTENYNREVAKTLSLNTLSHENIQDALMYFMRKSDYAVQTSNFYAYLNNTIVQDGEVVNVREYLRTQPKYADRYAGTPEQRKQLEQEFEADVKQLVEEKGVLKMGKVVDNQFVIPGVDRKSDSVVTLRRTVQQLTKNAMGNLSADDVRMINLTVYGKSFMVFRNWIPRLVDVRFGNVKYNNASDAYEWGRMRMVFRILSEDLLGSLGNLRNSLIANEKGVVFMRELYEKKKADYEKDTGKTLEMTEDEFIDLVRANLRGTTLDVLLLVSLFSLVAALKANMPDDDEDDAVKAQYRFIVKAADKLKDELAYFYDPTSFTSLVGKGLFPSLSLVDNATKAFTNFFRENWALAMGDEEKVEDTKVIKYWMKTFPFTNQMAGYLPMFFPELAKDLGLRVQSNYGLR